jgi:hypothetical protein
MITFAILDCAVVKESQVFDHLVRIKRLDTGEEGLLLCSHCCQWPAHLIPQATWLEGCFTPEEYKDEPRLMLGYHPNQLTSWKIDWEKREVTLSLVKLDGSGGDLLTFPVSYTRLNVDTALYRKIDHYLRRIPQEGTFAHYLQQVFSFVVRLYDRTGDISLVLASSAWIMNNNPYQAEGVNIHFIAGEWESTITGWAMIAEQPLSSRCHPMRLSECGILTGPHMILPWVDNYQVDSLREGTLTVYSTVGPWMRAEDSKVFSEQEKAFMDFLQF